MIYMYNHADLFVYMFVYLCGSLYIVLISRCSNYAQA